MSESKASSKLTGILGAMPEEVNGIIGLLENREEEVTGMRTYYRGRIQGKEVVVAFSRWGKVAAATTVTTMIQRYGITELLFTGVAGALSPALRIGDIVMADRLVQHDMDARPLLPRYEVPLLGLDFFLANHPGRTAVYEAIGSMLENRVLHRVFDEKTLERFQIHHPGLFCGDMASGDRFFASRLEKEEMHLRLPDVLCVEMEGAPVAQVCYEHGIPFLVLRIISDTAGDGSQADFTSFVNEIASPYTREIVSRIIGIMGK